ncbi:PREDICTED: RUN and SH3 domain-containing protein 1 [Nanorana parkeri]|uniref:RUN and SH3 domain-containing protein 1 n=1 Tax=Nanorana parkeri TaxID=125878 RepID=UPI00085426D6|nr:PREDICTED: RUN and SH3 domain-containing protein 1 [Nanorana parkeri]
MLTSRKALISNLNYVHLQHVSLGVHLSMRPEMMEGPVGQGTGLKDVPAHQHHYKDTSDMVLVDANSNDPTVPCQCCDHHSSHAETIKYRSNENLETIMCDDYLSPDELPLSPLSPSCPSTDSSSSSDFTLDDSPVSIYYKEYAQDGLETPDQQPDIIPLDVETENSPFPALNDSIDASHPTANNALASELRAKMPENTINNNMDMEDVPFIDWSSDTDLDSNCNAFPDIQQPGQLSMCYAYVDVDAIVSPKPQPDTVEKEDIANANQTSVPQWPLDGDLLPSLSAPEDSSTETPKKTITSFHELAQKRRKSGGLPQPKKDKSDWLIVFSPDVEHPPVNELTASAFYHGLVMPQAQPLPEGKEVTTFRELRYRNSVNKQISQQAKAPSTVAKGPQDSAEGVTDPAEVQLKTELQKSSPYFIDKRNLQDSTRESDEREQGLQEGNNGPVRGIQKPDMKLQLDTPEAPHKLWARNDHRPGTLSAMTVKMGKQCPPISINNMYTRNEDNMAGVHWRGMADGGDRRGLEVFGAPQPSRLFLRLSTNLTPPPALLPLGSALEVPRCFALSPQPWCPRLPARLSPVGASSPPQRALLPLLESPDVAILLSPLFPRIRSRETRPSRAPTADSPDTGGVGEPLMADGAGDTLLRDKKSLLIAIGSSVDRIISHFNGSRNQVQKAQLGDSRLSPKLGYLILNSLCPALFSLLGDGLKPFQKDVIIGRRRLSPWNLVEASTKSGPESLHFLFYNVSQYQQLRDPQRRFNAFIFGLLNTKQLDIWVSFLHLIYDQLSVFFLPTGFLPLAATSCPELREELLLTLQPLSALTFHTDLLFEHHHLPLQDPPTPHSPSTPADNWGVPPFQHILDLGGWLAHNLTGNADKEKPKESQTQLQSPCFSSSDPKHDGAVCYKDCPKDSLYKNQQRVSPPGAGIMTSTETQQGATSKAKDSSTTWWGQLSQASRQYIPANKDSFAFASFRKPRGAPDKQQSQLEQQLPSKVGECTEQRLPEQPHCERDCKKTTNGTETMGMGMRQPRQSSRDPTAANISGSEDTTPRQGGPTQCRQPVVVNGGRPTPCQTPEEKGGWFGQLFGTSSAHSRDLEGRSVKSRRPSSWLPPNVNVLNLIRLLSTPEPEQVFPAEQEERHQSDRKSERSLRAMCDHAASGEAQLSFKKGDVLQLLGTVDEDWIRCRRGSDMGLVPVGYTSLIL